MKSGEESKEFGFTRSVRCSFVGLMILVATLLGYSQEVRVNQGREELPAAHIAGDAAPLVPDLENVVRTPGRLTRGKYLVEGLLQCTMCHSKMDYTHLPALPVPESKGGGRIFGQGRLPKGTLIVAPNISSDPEYGAGEWMDGDFVRALRQGIGHDGRILFQLMPYEYFRNLSDEDLASVIVYERSLAPVHIQQPKTVLPESIAKAIQPLPPIEHVPEPDKSDQINYGKYLVTVAHCKACHTPHDEDGELISGLEFSGGQVFTGPFGPDGRTVQVASLNLTSDPSGIPYFDERRFIEVIRSGRVSARPLASVMPWAYFRNLTDVDLKAIFAYLRSLPAVKHRVDNTEPPTYCRVCRHTHGLGNLN